MRTVKVVVIGSSGVGKTSLRNQYISGRFTTGYRATIGADFITKTVPHWRGSDEKIVLQIWDTAGQERFSGLSSAFFRGADAVLLIFDVNRPDTLQALRKWWNEFKDHAPLADEDADGFCVVFVGNKIDLQGQGTENGSGSTSRNSQVTIANSQQGGQGKSSISRDVASKFIEELIPPPPTIDEPHAVDEEADNQNTTTSLAPGMERTFSIDISPNKKRRALSHSRSRSRNGLGTVGTMMTATSTFSMYHTPSSSIYDSDGFESARSSPIPPASSHSSPRSSKGSGQSRSPPPIHRKRSIASILTASSDAPTITPSLIVNSNGSAAPHDSKTQAPLPEGLDSLIEESSHEQPPSRLEPPDRGPRLFFTSARTGQGVEETFGYVAKRVVTCWEWEELMRESAESEESDDPGLAGTGRQGRGTVRLGPTGDGKARGKGECCGS